MNLFFTPERLTLTAIVLLVAAIPSFSPSALCQDGPDNIYVVLRSEGELKIGEILINSEKIGLYEKFEASFSLEGDWENPFDPEQIKVDARFYSPDGKQLLVPGFFYQEYRNNSYRSIEKVGKPEWKIRFTPVMEGEYKFEIIAKNKDREIISRQKSFTGVSFNVTHGFLKISKTNPLYFEFEDGQPFFAVAVDNAVNNYFNYMKIYPRFAETGGNYNRLFIMSGDLDLGEEIRPSAGPDRGLGKINLDASWKLDRVIEMGEMLGIYHQMCMTNQYNFNLGWKYNVFNKENGGILESPKEYFTSEESMKYLEKRFRYVIARWGYSTAVFSWNLWNEYSAQPGFEVNAAVAWHQRMARYISLIDPFGHVIHTNDGRLNGVDEISALPETEIITTNTYGIKNIADVSEVWTKKFITRFKKPYMLAEFGIGHSNLPPGGYGEVDPEKRMIHDGLWSPLMSGSAGTGMPWEWIWLDNRIVYTFLKAVSKVVEDVPFSKYDWTPVSVTSFKFKKSQPSYYADVVFEGWNPTGNYGMPKEAAEQKIFNITGNGRVEPNEYLHSRLVDTTGRKNSRSVPSVAFKVEYPVNGEFVVFASDVRNVNPVVKLRVSVDGKEVLNKDLLPKPFLQYFPVNVPGGSHTIIVENAGGGSFQTAFELRNYKLKEGPDLEVRGLQSDDYILLWIKNQKYTLLHELAGIGFSQQPEGVLELKNVADGSWMAEWVNTIDARVLKTELVQSKGGRMILNTPAVNESIAVRLLQICAGGVGF
ncbi:MAG: hypothetical protein A2X04_12245 [Bacteroidetes bacterium GWF2_41_9]|nr:MAG: hypothetical protein A2X04_12245 [Bacteroidetes bacterium GWF2_41_9]HAM11395.1 hypothetical protein [Bacteroidales bacterium]